MGKTAAKRGVSCPRCDTQFEVGTATKSTVCPGCNKNVRVEDEKINEYCARQEVFTEGTIEVTKKGHVIAEIRARTFLVAGEVKGTVRVRETMRIEKTGKVFGNVTVPTLVVEDGAALVGYCVIGVPVAVPAPAAAAPVAAVRVAAS